MRIAGSSPKRSSSRPHRGDPARHLALAGRPAAGVRHDPRQCIAAVRCELGFRRAPPGRWLSLAARTDSTPEFADYLARGFPVDRENDHRSRGPGAQPVQVLDFMAEPGMRMTPAHRERIRSHGPAVPLLREDRLLGVIALRRREVRAFSEKQIACCRPSPIRR